MSIKLDMLKTPAGNLFRKSTTFVSPDVEGLKMVNKTIYKESPLNPLIETNKILDQDVLKAQFTSKRLSNGDRVEHYNFPDELIRVVKNKFGQIKEFKSSIEQHNTTPKQTYEDVKNAMTSLVRSFLSR